jgi:phage tail-like protein
MLVANAILGALAPAFRFVVAVDGMPLAAFTECTLPAVEWTVEDLPEGGLNTYVHQLPGRRQRSRITLKNGIVRANLLLPWLLAAMMEKISRRRVTVILLDPLLVPVMTWHIEGAFPVRWSGPQLRSDDNTVAMETLELACGEITVV